MANTWISGTETDVEELQITHEDITRSYITLKVSRKSQKKNNSIGLRKGESNTREE